MRMAWILMAGGLTLGGCDYAETTVTSGQQAADAARDVVGVDADRQISRARELIRLGKVADARRALDAVQENEASLSEENKEKLALALEELEAASR